MMASRLPVGRRCNLVAGLFVLVQVVALTPRSSAISYKRIRYMVAWGTV